MANPPQRPDALERRPLRTPPTGITPDDGHVHKWTEWRDDLVCVHCWLVIDGD